MTTTVTLRTHDWPVAVTTTNYQNTDQPLLQAYGHSHQTEFVPANSERSFSIYEGRDVSFKELAKEATDLKHDPASSIVG